MSDIIARLKVLKHKINLKERHVDLNSMDVDVCEVAAKTIENLRYGEALLDDEIRKLSQKIIKLERPLTTGDKDE